MKTVFQRKYHMRLQRTFYKIVFNSLDFLKTFCVWVLSSYCIFIFCSIIVIEFELAYELVQNPLNSIKIIPLTLVDVVSGSVQSILQGQSCAMQ